MTEDGNHLTQRWHMQPHFWEAGGSNSDCSRTQNPLNCFLEPSGRQSPPRAARIAVFHYITRSFEDFEAKLRRGAGVPFFTRDEAWFRRIEECAAPASLLLNARYGLCGEVQLSVRVRRCADG